MNSTWNIKSIADVRGTPKNPTLIHMTTPQWKHATRGIPVDNVPDSTTKHVFSLIGIPDPEGGVLLYPNCPNQGPDTQCMVVQRFLGGSLVYECRCRNRRKSPQLSPPAPCRLSITPGVNPTITCMHGTCSRNCRLTLQREKTTFGLTLYRLVCACA
jgi:hypothetical protein